MVDSRAFLTLGVLCISGSSGHGVEVWETGGGELLWGLLEGPYSEERSVHRCP